MLQTVLLFDEKKMLPGYTGRTRWKNFKLWYKVLHKKYWQYAKFYPNSDGIYFFNIAEWAWYNSGYYDIIGDDTKGKQNYKLK